MREVKLKLVYWFGLDPWALLGHETVPRDVGIAKLKDGTL